MRKVQIFKVRDTWVQILLVLFIGGVIWGKILNYSESHFKNSYDDNSQGSYRICRLCE